MDEDTLVGCGGCLLAVIVVGAIALLPFVKFDTTENGNHIGQVSAVQQQGIFFKNYQVFFKTSNDSSQEDEYCVNRNNKALADKLVEASRTGEKVAIEYKGVIGFGLDLCSGQEINKVIDLEQN